MAPTPPFWFKQRQCKAEPQGENMLKVSGPNLGEFFLYVREAGGKWSAGLRRTADSEDLASTEPEAPSEKEAWDAAFELFRIHVIT